MHGIYLKCECCPATIGGEQVTQNPEPPLNRHQGVELRKRAKERGWIQCTLPMGKLQHHGDPGDLCPECAKLDTDVAIERQAAETARWKELIKG